MAAALVLALIGAGCHPGSSGRSTAATAAATPPTTPATSDSTPTAPTSAQVAASAAAPVTTTTDPGRVLIDYRVERRASDPATAGFEAAVEATLTDSRGWQRAGFVFDRRTNARFSVILAEPDEAEALCRPYDVFRQYSCQNGPVVVINAERWRHATPEWTGDLATYRLMLVNHEVGHLLGLHHPPAACPHPGQPAAVMDQQSTELHGCLPNPWPLDAEVAIAARHDLPLAPPFER